MTSTAATHTTQWEPRDGTAPNAQRLLAGPGLTLVRFSFRAHQVLAEHRAAGPILIECVFGALDLTVTTSLGIETHQLEAGTVVYVAGGDPHHLAAQHDSVVHVVLRHQNEGTKTNPGVRHAEHN